MDPQFGGTTEEMDMAKNTPMTKGDAARVQSTTDKGGGQKDGLEERAQAVADKNADKGNDKPAPAKK
jgi:hypothetical protein